MTLDETIQKLQEAKLSVRAATEEIICDSARGLEHATLRELSSCQWVRSHHNLLLLGATGVGKSFLASALANAAIRQGFRALFMRVPRLLEQLAIARASADYSAMLARLAKIDVLILDDFLLAPMTDVERRDLLSPTPSATGSCTTRTCSPCAARPCAARKV